MKKLLIAAAVSTLSITAAQAAPTLYGKLNVTLDQVDNSDFAGNDVTALNSNGWKIRDSLMTGDGLKFILIFDFIVFI